MNLEQLENFEVYRSGALLTMRCTFCGAKWPVDQRINLATLVNIADEHTQMNPTPADAQGGAGHVDG